MSWADGSRYEGAFRDDDANGYGVFYYASGDRYDGNFLDGQFHGAGTNYWSDGSSWEGPFVSNQLHGQGVFTNTSGYRSIVVYSYDQIVN